MFVRARDVAQWRSKPLSRQQTYTKAERRQAIRQIRSSDRRDTEQNVRDTCMRKSLRFQLHPKRRCGKGEAAPTWEAELMKRSKRADRMSHTKT